MKRTILCTFTFVLLFGVFSAMAATLYCGRCGKVITGRYYTYSKSGQPNLIVCENCDHMLPHCDGCGIPFNKNELTNVKGEKLCSSCLANAQFCSLCGHRIEGKYYQSRDGKELYCLSCYNRYPRCMVCDRPGPVHRLANGKTICDDCLKKVPRCGACGQPVIGSYYKVNNSKEVFCEQCMRSAPRCYSCGIPLGKNHWLFDDGRRICDACNQRSVYDLNRIQAIMKEVEQLCASQLGMTVTTPYTLQIKDLNKQSSDDAQKAKHGLNEDSPLYGKELGLYRRMAGKSEIFLLYGLPQEMVYDTAAHEFAHAWQAEHCPPGQSADLMEGFAQWVSAQILRVKGFAQALERLEARTDSPYGTGYRKIKQIGENLGRAGLFEFVQKATR